MEALFKKTLSRWNKNTQQIQDKQTIYLLSTNNLSAQEKESLKSDYLDDIKEFEKNSRTLSIIISLAMNHIYFRLGSKTFDYRPHRGKMSRLACSDYRLAKTERVEVFLNLSKNEERRLIKYINNIESNREQVLGAPYPLSLFEHDFTVKEFQTNGELNNNKMIKQPGRHNCLTWLTTAPLGERGESLYQILGMTIDELKKETHSYIVPFYRFLVQKASFQRVPFMTFWTNQDVKEAVKKIDFEQNFILDFYNPPGYKPIEQSC